jgi:predicted small lipoprotein YifL
MRKTLLIPGLALIAFGLAGCGSKAPNEALEANETIPGDSNAMGEAVDDVNIAFANSDIVYDNSAEPAPSGPVGNASNEEGSGDE